MCFVKVFSGIEQAVYPWQQFACTMVCEQDHSGAVVCCHLVNMFGTRYAADNRSLLHCATWYDAERHTRLMWRTTVMGNPGDEYAGEDKSWIPRDGSAVMAGMEHA